MKSCGILRVCSRKGSLNASSSSSSIFFRPPLIFLPIVTCKKNQVAGLDQGEHTDQWLEEDLGNPGGSSFPPLHCHHVPGEAVSLGGKTCNGLIVTYLRFCSAWVLGMLFTVHTKRGEIFEIQFVFDICILIHPIAQCTMCIFWSQPISGNSAHLALSAFICPLILHQQPTAFNAPLQKSGLWIYTGPTHHHESFPRKL